MATNDLFRTIRFVALIPLTAALLFYGLLALGTVPAPNGRNAELVTGRVMQISAPHADYGGLSIVLEGGRYFYVNRADEVDHFAWEAFLSEVRPGDEVTLTAVSTVAKRWFGVTRSISPVAGVATADKVYMDSAVASRTWTAQAEFAKTAAILGAVWLALLLAGFFIGGRNKNDQLQLDTA